MNTKRRPRAKVQDVDESDRAPADDDDESAEAAAEVREALLWEKLKAELRRKK